MAQAAANPAPAPGITPAVTFVGSSVGGHLRCGGPGVSAAIYSVYVRGTDGAVWSRSRTTSGWGSWHSLGCKLYNGNGPSATYLGGTYVLAVGTNRGLYLAEAEVTGSHPAGGLTTASPGLTAM